MNLTVIRGGIAVSREAQLNAGMQTCCAIVYYDKKGLYGIAHAVVPSTLENYHRKVNEISPDFIVTPAQGAKSLLEQMIANGARKEDLHAGVFGCKNEAFGNENASEAQTTLMSLDIPIVHNFTRTPHDTELVLNPQNILIKILEAGKVLKEAELQYS